LAVDMEMNCCRVFGLLKYQPPSRSRAGENSAVDHSSMFRQLGGIQE